MFPLLLAASLYAAPALSEDPHKPAAPKAEPPAHGAPKEEPKPAKPKRRTSIAIPEEPPQPPPAKAEPEPKPTPKPAPKAQPKPKPTPTPTLEEIRRMAEAEARAARLAAENARLQEALARKESTKSPDILTPTDAMEELKRGNLRFAEGRRTRTLFASQDPGLRQTLAKGQAPFAVIVTCSDSRVMDNLIFDQELGRLFTVREAGNSPDIQGIASVEYAVEHLGSKLVVVLGHTACGAVKAVAESHGKPLPGNLWSLQAAMAGLLEAVHVDPNLSHTEHLRELERTNAVRQAQGMLDRSEIIRHLQSAGKIQVRPAVYDLASGQVVFLDLPKKEAEIGHH